jgi:hypothetical protein
MSDSPALKAVLDFIKDAHPRGTSEKGNRWYPYDDERASCCSSIREPSRKWPWSLYKHCFTRVHKRNRLLEHPTDVETQALAMTMETAPLHVNEEGLLFHVAKKLMGE